MTVLKIKFRVFVFLGLALIFGCATQQTDNQTPSEVNPESHFKNCGANIHGTTKEYFLHPTGTKLTPCAPLMTTCLNGQWVPAFMYDSCVNTEN